MTIIHVPHPTLRKQTQKVVSVDEQLLRFIDDLQQTLEKKRNPRGVGLSAPQVDFSQSVFVTLLPPSDHVEADPVLRTFINPQIVATSPSKTFGDDHSKPILEGCLSIPNLYGPVPRFDWIELEYQEIVNDQLKYTKERFYDFTARVVQHEYDHLIGKLFTDYILEFELPLYDDKSGKLKEIDRKIAEKF